MRHPLPSESEISQLPPDGGEHYNRLVFAQSPYLLQHAANPVDWYPWGDEAFERARQLDKPIFLSIGYATCHWCHVMERESFENPSIAAMLNEHCVCIKVDREERPDIDDIYMKACQAMTGQGGWPLSAFLTTDRQPFFVGTYFPPKSVPGRIGVPDLVARVANVWANQRENVVEEASRLTNELKRVGQVSPGDDLGSEVLDIAWQQLLQRYDEEEGGFGDAPKFPTPHNLLFLLRYDRLKGQGGATEMVLHTLRAMRHGGIFDHVGFGFHRYSTDAHWLLPHFEKMLYDQALLAMAYSEAWLVSGEEEFARTAREIFTYVLRDMTHPEGGFYSAEDADSEGVEGKFYIWQPQEVMAILGEEEGAFYCDTFNIEQGGNFADEATGMSNGENIPHLDEPYEQLINENGGDSSAFFQRVEACRARLFEEREKRIHPLKDDKVLTDWNGLMIAALAIGGRALADETLTAAAAKAAGFVMTHLRDGEGRLLKRFRKGKAGLSAHLDDYAFFVWGLLELYQATGETHWLSTAKEMVEQTLARFFDEEGGCFYFTASDSEPLIMRGRDIYDGAIPSGNSTMTLNLLRLGQMLGEARYVQMGERVIRAWSKQVSRYPSASSLLMCALFFKESEKAEVVLCGKGKELDEMKAMLDRQWLPHVVYLLRGEDEALTEMAPFTRDMSPGEGSSVAAFVCKNFSCNRPVSTAAELAELLGLQPGNGPDSVGKK